MIGFTVPHSYYIYAHKCHHTANGTRLASIPARRRESIMTSAYDTSEQGEAVALPVLTHDDLQAIQQRYAIPLSSLSQIQIHQRAAAATYDIARLLAALQHLQAAPDTALANATHMRASPDTPRAQGTAPWSPPESDSLT